MSVERIKISDLNLIRRAEDIPENFTSVRGEYEIPQISKTGFLRINDCMNETREDEDLRELFASKILDKMNFPHAEILLASDEEKGRDGCLFINILNKNEEFVRLDSESKGGLKKGKLTIKEFIEDNLRKTSEIPGITKKDLDNRRDYLIKYLFASALIFNSNLKIDNFNMIQDKVTGKFRNPEYYDMGVAFLNNKSKKLLDKFTANEVIEQLYEQYPDQTKLIGKNVQKNLNIDIIDELLNEEVFQEFPEETQIEIHSQMLDRLELIEKLNTRKQNKYNTGKPIDSKNVKKEELKLAISEWSEGNSKLEEAITQCIQNGIPTYASCKGHGLLDSPYLSMIITKSNLEKVLNIMNEVTKMKSTEILISYMEANSLKENNLSLLTVYSNILNRNKVFEKIAEASKTEINLEECSEDVQNLWNFHKATRTSDIYFDLFNDVYYNTKKLEITTKSQNFNLYDILKEQGLKSKKREWVGTVFYAKKGINNTLKELTTTLENYYLRDEDDEFFERKEENKKEKQFKEKLEVKLEKVNSTKDKAEKQINNKQSEADKVHNSIDDEKQISNKQSEADKVRKSIDNENEI